MGDSGEISASIRNMDVFYENKQALFGVDLDIQKKKVTSLIGPSGCGKSTLLRCFNRMNDEVEGCSVKGELIIDDRNVYGKNVDVCKLRAKVGMVFQKPNPFPKSIYDNIAYGPRLHGTNNKKGQLDEVVEKSLRRVGLWDEVYDRLKENAVNLSGGQRQRLCIARAIAVKPALLLMDEPCSALDPIATSAIEDLVQELKQKFTIIVVTHSIKQTQKISDMVAFFHKGKILQYSSYEDLLNNPTSKYIKSYLELGN